MAPHAIIDPHDLSDYYPSSDPSLPSLEFVMSQSQRIKSEPRNSQSFIPESSINKKEYQAAVDHDAMHYDYDTTEDSQTRPKQKIGGEDFSWVRKIKVVKKESVKTTAPLPKINTKSSQPAPRPSQAPPASQMIDLTLSSSPIEPVAPEPSQVFHTAPEVDENDDENDYTGPTGSGWVPKRTGNRGKSMDPSIGAGRRGSVAPGGGRSVSSTQPGKGIPKTKWTGDKKKGKFDWDEEYVQGGRRKTYSGSRY